MTFGGAGFWKIVGELGQTEVDKIVGAALDAGINFIDTANVETTTSDRAHGQRSRAAGASVGDAPARSRKSAIRCA
jgi:aryl-alcohol dehydrogenase-like predicted oxidoreductase